jgi:ADP-ribosylation factor-binding protein GGA
VRISFICDLIKYCEELYKIENKNVIFYLVKATSPIHKSADPNLMNLFCSKVNAEPEGHQQAIRLISHKIQSPQEHEALRTLELLEVCVQSCGRRFHQEIGKFRFLNEMIKLVSPKVKLFQLNSI